MKDLFPIRLTCAVALLLASWPGHAQKAGGTLRVPLRDNPPSASIHEETTSSTLVPFMPAFNNLVVFDQQSKRSDPSSIKPDLATEWAWSDGDKTLTFKLQPGVKWHDGKSFTSADVKCTWDTARGVRDAGWRKTPRASWYSNLQDVVVKSDLEVAFVLKRPQPSFLSFLASGFSPVYPCHVDARTMRTVPIGTGPFKVAEFRPNEVIRLVRNPDYFRKGRPLLDAITYTVVPNQGTRSLGFIAGDFDMTWTGDLSKEGLKDISSKLPKAICEMTETPTSGQLMVNPKVAKLNDPRFRRALALAIDKNGLASALTQTKSLVTGVMMAPPDGAWGLKPEDLKDAPGYGPDVEKSRNEARALMRQLGYGPDNPLKVKFMSVNRGPHTAPMLIVIDQLRSIFIEGTLDAVDISVWTQRVTRRADYELSYWSSAPALDDPDPILYEGYKCGSSRNYTDYCDKKTDEMIEQQSVTQNVSKRQALVHAIDKKLQMEAARVVLHGNILGSCRSPSVKGTVVPTNSIYNTYRYEAVWLDQ